MAPFRAGTSQAKNVHGDLLEGSEIVCRQWQRRRAGRCWGLCRYRYFLSLKIHVRIPALENGAGVPAVLEQLWQSFHYCSPATPTVCLSEHPSRTIEVITIYGMLRLSSQEAPPWRIYSTLNF